VQVRAKWELLNRRTYAKCQNLCSVYQDLYCVPNENGTFGVGVRNYLRAVRKGLRTPNGHHKSVSLKRNAV